MCGNAFPSPEFVFGAAGDLVKLGSPMKKTLLLAWLAVCVVVCSVWAESAPKPLYRDPVHDGAADPVVIWNPQVKRWWMFYTNRRATITNEPGVAWVHGTRLGIAESTNGANWNYVGTADIELPEEYGDQNITHWAPEVFTAPDGLHHMFLTVVPGIFSDWNHPRSIVQLTSPDLQKWGNAKPLKLASDRVIDACVLRINEGPNQIWRMWYNNERDRKSIYYADSPDLVNWVDKGKAVGDQSGEGPKVFRWQNSNSYWMVTDVWRGLGVYRSDDALNWKRQSGGNLLQQPGTGADDQVMGGHPDIVVNGDRAFLFYFTHPSRRDGAPKTPYEHQRSSILVTELFYRDGQLTCDRELTTDIQLAPPTATVGSAPFQVNIRVDAAQELGAWPEVWRFFGADEPNYAYMKNGRKLLGELGKLKRDQVYFRAHNLLCSGDGTPALKWGSTGVYREDAQGKAIYDWTILDRIFDAYRDNGVRPFAQIGFMPEALSIKPQPYQHVWTPAARYEEIMTGWAYPPKDYNKWRELVYQWVKHCVERYGREEVAQWYWEVWNEANGHYWKAKPEEFHKLHDYAIDGVRRALPEARVGGPHAAGSGGQWTRNFLEHNLRGTNYATGKIGTPIDFVAFHAKGSPTFTNGHVRMGISSQLRAINDGFKIVASYPELKPKPIIIGESDPEGCAACQGEQLGYRNGTMYSSYTAASFARKIELARRHGVNFEGALTWAFTFEDQPLFAGFRQIATGGIDMPVLNVFRMFSQMGGQQLAVTSDAAVSVDDMMRRGVRGNPDVGAQATMSGDKLCVLAWHYHDDDVAGAVAEVSLTLNGVLKEFQTARLTRYVIDQESCNSYTAWQKMGSPQQPTPEQYAQLEQAGKLVALPLPEPLLGFESGKATLRFKLPRQAVTLLVLEKAATK
jgi:xylan 1,4-beta-xylosidase